jgi:hypothetical protein
MADIKQDMEAVQKEAVLGWDATAEKEAAVSLDDDSTKAAIDAIPDPDVGKTDEERKAIVGF